jgi:hypothetical protein
VVVADTFDVHILVAVADTLAVEAVHRLVAVADTFAAEAVGHTSVAAVADILAVEAVEAVAHRLVVVVVAADTSVGVH